MCIIDIKNEPLITKNINKAMKMTDIMKAH